VRTDSSDRPQSPHNQAGRALQSTNAGNR
jgi:hypothetical protein